MQIAGVGAGVGSVGAGVGVWMRAHVFAACAARQFPTHVHPASHMQNHSAPTPLQTPPGCKSQPCASSKHGDTVGAGVGAAVGSGVGAGVHTGVGHGVAGTHVCGAWRA